MRSRVFATCVVLLTAACGAQPAAPVEIPLPDLARLEPQVADKIRAARAAVAARGDGDAWRHLGRVLLAHHQWPQAERAFAVAGELPGEQRAESLYLAGCAADFAGAPY